MTNVTIQDLINSAIQELDEFHLCDGTMDSYRSRAFKPVSDFYCQKEELHYQPELTVELKIFYQEQFNSGIISPNAAESFHQNQCWLPRTFDCSFQLRWERTAGKIF